MATVKTLGCVINAGFKGLHRFTVKESLSKFFQVRNNVLVRHCSRFSRYEEEPLEVGDSSLYTDFEVSRNPIEWKAVERLMPEPLIKTPSPKAEYPSGWRPQDPPEGSPYFIQRTPSHMLPVYLKRKSVRGELRATVVRRIFGDIWQLERELRAYLSEQYTPDNPLISRVDEVAGTILFDGDHVNYVKRYLGDRGW